MAAGEAQRPQLLLSKYLLLSTFVRRADATIADAAVLSALIERYNDSKGSAWPSQSTIAKDCGRDRRTVRRSLQRLRLAGFVDIEQRGGHTAVRHYKPCFGAGVRMWLAGAPSSAGGADAPSAGGADAPSAGGADAPRTHTTEPARVRGGEGACAAAVPAPACAPPPGIDPVDWSLLFAKRPDLDPGEIAESVAHHRAAGCPTEALNQAMDSLRLNRGYRSLSPVYKRARPASTAKRQPKPSAREGPPTTKASVPGITRPPLSSNVVSMQVALHPLQAQYQRFKGVSGVMRFEKDRLHARLRQEFPQQFEAVVVKRSAWPQVDAATQTRIAKMMADELALCRARINERALAYSARRAGGVAQ